MLSSLLLLNALPARGLSQSEQPWEAHVVQSLGFPGWKLPGKASSTRGIAIDLQRAGTARGSLTLRRSSGVKRAMHSPSVEGETGSRLFKRASLNPQAGTFRSTDHDTRVFPEHGVPPGSQLHVSSSEGQTGSQESASTLFRSDASLARGYSPASTSPSNLLSITSAGLGPFFHFHEEWFSRHPEHAKILVDFQEQSEAARQLLRAGHRQEALARGTQARDLYKKQLADLGKQHSFADFMLEEMEARDDVQFERGSMKCRAASTAQSRCSKQRSGKSTLLEGRYRQRSGASGQLNPRKPSQMISRQGGSISRPGGARPHSPGWQTAPTLARKELLDFLRTPRSSKDDKALRPKLRSLDGMTPNTRQRLSEARAAVLFNNRERHGPSSDNTPSESPSSSNTQPRSSQGSAPSPRTRETSDAGVAFRSYSPSHASEGSNRKPELGAHPISPHASLDLRGSLMTTADSQDTLVSRFDRLGLAATHPGPSRDSSPDRRQGGSALAPSPPSKRPRYLL